MLTYSKELNAYEIIGYNQVSRESDVAIMNPVKRKSVYHKSMRFQNDVTKQWESLALLMEGIQ